MNNKEKFEEPRVEFVLFPAQDIVTTSGGIVIKPDEQGGGIVLPDDNW